MTYFIVLTIHLLAAIIFVGFLFTEVVIMPVLGKKKGAKFLSEAMGAISKRVSAIMPTMVLVLFLSGGYMVHYHIPINLLFGIKIALAVLIGVGVLYAIGSMYLPYEPPAGFGKKFHLFAIIAAFVIVILAKFMFVVSL